jgi:hypothetical protein
MPVLILLDQPQRRQIWFSQCIAVGREVSSHWRTTAGQTHYRHFAIVRARRGFVIYDHDDTAGTYLSLDDAEPVRICGGPMLLEDGMLIQANRLRFQFRDVPLSEVQPPPDLVVGDEDHGWAEPEFALRTEPKKWSEVGLHDFVSRFLPPGVSNEHDLLYDFDHKYAFVPTRDQLSACLEAFGKLLANRKTLALWGVLEALEANELMLAYVGRALDKNPQLFDGAIVAKVLPVAKRLLSVCLDGRHDSYDAVKRLSRIVEALEQIRT